MTRSPSRASLPHLSDEAVAAFADGVLPPGPFGRAQKHLVECVGCTQAVRDQQAARVLLRAAAIPAAPGALLDRLRQLPTTSPLGAAVGGGQGSELTCGMSVDGQPVFAAFHTRERQTMTSSIATAALAPEPARAARSHRQPHLPVLGVSAAAAVTVIVGVLAGTAASAGGTAAPDQRPAFVPAGATVSVAPSTGTAPVLNLTGKR